MVFVRGRVWTRGPARLSSGMFGMGRVVGRFGWLVGWLVGQVTVLG